MFKEKKNLSKFLQIAQALCKKMRKWKKGKNEKQRQKESLAILPPKDHKDLGICSHRHFFPR